MSFHNVEFPSSIALGATGGPARRVNIQTLANGNEVRDTPWAQSRRQYSVGSGVKTLPQLYEIIEFYEARLGQLYGFRFKDWTDYKSCSPSQEPHFQDQTIARGDDKTTNFQIKKFYFSGGHSSGRVITKPKIHSMKVGIGPRECDDDEFEVDDLKGIIHFFSPPENGAPITAGYEFDTPVRFDCDSLNVNLAQFTAGEIPQIPLIEIWE